MSLEEFAQTELNALGYFDGDEMNAVMAENVMDLIRVFSMQGHSGMSATWCVSLFERAARWQPLGPLTGQESEWYECAPGVWQNIRCGSVFKDADGRAYDIQGSIFVERNGCFYTSFASRRYVTFPYVPTAERIREYSPRWFVVKAQAWMRRVLG